VENTKKADVAKRSQAFHHVGLLINKHAGETSPFFDLSSGICRDDTFRDSAYGANVSYSGIIQTPEFQTMHPVLISTGDQSLDGIIQYIFTVLRLCR
jgi:hypothetical protein